jgi:hypothetical protein
MLVLAGCGSHEASSSATPSPGPGDVIVHAGYVDDALQFVAHSTLPASDKKLFAAFFAKNRNRPTTYDGQTVQRIINFQIAYNDGLRDVALAEAREDAAARQIAPLLDAAVLSGKDDVDRIAFVVRVHNKTAKTIKHVDLGLDIFDVTTKGAVGHIELNIDRIVAPHTTATFQVPVMYRLFDADAGMMMGAARHPKRFVVSPDSVQFTDGSVVGAQSD